MHGEVVCLVMGGGSEEHVGLSSKLQQHWICNHDVFFAGCLPDRKRMDGC